MPIRKQVKPPSSNVYQPPHSAAVPNASLRTHRGPEIDPRTGRPVMLDEQTLPPSWYAKDAQSDLPSYDASEDAEFLPNKLLDPTTDGDLRYFNAVLSGLVPDRRPANTTLVMNLFRLTHAHVSPVAERIVLGPIMEAPFYNIVAGPSVSSIDEFNKLTVTRRTPVTSSWNDVCVCEIRPRLDLLAHGVMTVATITWPPVNNFPSLVYSLTWERSRDSYTLWAVGGLEDVPVADFVCDGWSTLDDFPSGGVLRAKDIGNIGSDIHNDLAVLDATKPSPQFICASDAGQKTLDLLVVGMMTAAILHTRRTKLVDKHMQHNNQQKMYNQHGALMRTV